MSDYYFNSDHQKNGTYTMPSGNYMRQEDEWDREGLLDPAWEIQQKKVCFLDILVMSNGAF